MNLGMKTMINQLHPYHQLPSLHHQQRHLNNNYNPNHKHNNHKHHHSSQRSLTFLWLAVQWEVKSKQNAIFVKFDMRRYG